MYILVLVIGLASGFMFLNFLLILIWCLCWRTKRHAKLEQEKFTSLEKWPPTLRQKRPGFHVQVETTHSKKSDQHLSSCRRTAPKRHSMHIFSSFHTPEHGENTTARPPGLFPLINQLSVPLSIVRENSAQSDDSTSIYSTASAPIELHDQLFNSKPFVGIVHTNKPDISIVPRGMDTPSNVTRDIGLFYPRVPKRWASVIREELAPEAYDRTLRDQARTTRGAPSCDVVKSGDLTRTYSHTVDICSALLPAHPNPTLVTPPDTTENHLSLVHRQIICHPYDLHPCSSRL